MLCSSDSLGVVGGAWVGGTYSAFEQDEFQLACGEYRDFGEIMRYSQKVLTKSATHCGTQVVENFSTASETQISSAPQSMITDVDNSPLTQRAAWVLLKQVYAEVSEQVWQLPDAAQTFSTVELSPLLATQGASVLVQTSSVSQ